MTGVLLQRFAALAPRVDPTQLADHFATVAENLLLDHEVLAPLPGLGAEGPALPADTASLFYYNATTGWLSSTGFARWVRSLLPGDVRELLYSIDGSYPKIRSGGAVYRLGLPRPAAPSIDVDNSTAGDLSDPSFLRQQTYTISWVDAWEREGPLSVPSTVHEVGPGASIRLNLPATPSGTYNWGAGAKIRIYRSNTGNSATLWQYVGEVAIGAGIFTDAVEPEDLQEAAPNETWIGPPDDDTATYPDGPLASLVELPGAVLAGHAGKSVYFSEPYVPHAWPLAYRITQSADIVALAAVSGGLFVATTDKPYLIAGTVPGSMAPLPIESAQACVSAASMVDMGDYCIYASPEGLVQGQGNSAQLITTSWVDADTWAAIGPETVRGFAWRGKYVGFYGDVDDATGFIFDPREPEKGLILLAGLKVGAGHWDSATDTLWLAVKNGAGVWHVQQFAGGAPLTWVWQSKELLTPADVSLSCARIESDSWPVQFTLWADGVQKANAAIPDGRSFRLPGGFRARRWQFRLSGTGRVSLAGLWDSMSEVK